MLGIVGWDDNYDKSNFLQKPKNNGAFLVRNSWGTNDHGYYWVSYEDKSIVPTYTIQDYEKTASNERIYNLEEGALCPTVTINKKTAGFVNIFSLKGKEQLDKISFYTSDVGAEYQIYYVPLDQDGNLDRIMWWQLMIVLLVLFINVVYWIFADGGLQTYFYYILSFVNIIVLVYYAYFFSQTILKYKLKHPHAYPSLRWMIGLEKVGLYGVCSLSVLVNFWLDRRLFLVFTFLYTLLFIILVLLYHNHEVIWALHSLTKRYQKIPNKDKETKKSIPSATSVHTGRQTILNNDKIAERVAEWVNNHGYRQASITIKILSKELGINRTYLSNFINEVYGTNFNGWINELRVKEAKSKMCESPELSLSEIADFVGFADSAHFSKQFKQNEGVSPSVWRKNKIRDKEK